MLNDSERSFLGAVREGESAAAYARRNNYSPDWAKWMSKQIREKLDVHTLREAVTMAEENEGVSRGDFDKLFGAFTKLSDTVEELAKRPNDPAAQQQVRDHELDVKDHAKALGLSLDDVEKLKDEKEFGKFKAMQDRLDKERLEAEAEEDEDDSANGGGKTLGEKVRDGLGGISGVKQQ